MYTQTHKQYSCSCDSNTIKILNKMMKFLVALAALVAITYAKPALVSAPIVTASSSQYYHRINNGLAVVAAPAAYVAPAVASAAYVAPAAAPYIASPYIASPYVAASAPIIAV